MTRFRRGRYLIETSGCNDCHTPGYAAKTAGSTKSSGSPVIPWDGQAIYAHTRSLGPAGMPAPAHVPPRQKAQGPVVRFPE